MLLNSILFVQLTCQCWSADWLIGQCWAALIAYINIKSIASPFVHRIYIFLSIYVWMWWFLFYFHEKNFLFRFFRFFYFRCIKHHTFSAMNTSHNMDYEPEGIDHMNYVVHMFLQEILQPNYERSRETKKTKRIAYAIDSFIELKKEAGKKIGE